ncbi:MAG: undecaprenyl-diphosphate phosphatase [Oscillospiraceae bacterium]|nr:undecaprenyl-diphosphate phosphatase [Oscillospiraceae bacterium]
MSWWQALLSGIIQGLTEFLPVSSSGHLVIFNALFGTAEGSDLAFTVFLHLGTLLSVAVVFRKDVWMLIREFFAALRDLLRGKPSFQTAERRFLLMVIAATIPAVLAGALVKLLDLDSILENIFVVAVMLIVTAAFMFLIDRLNKGEYTEKDMPFQSALLVGCLQAAAILPGLSRSGSTIFGGILGGLKKEFAVRFAFILSMPAILGAGLVEGLQAVKEGGFPAKPLNLLIGFAGATLCGILAISLIRLLMKNNRFYLFGIYCLCVCGVAFLVGFGVIGV